jgi:hypothetical protein
MSYLRTLPLCLFLLFLLVLSGCQTTTGYYLGALAQEDAVTQIAPVLDSQQQWEEFYVTVDSNLTRQAGNYQMSGWLSFSLHPRMMYVRVASVELTLFLLDAYSRVVDYRRATHFMGLSPEDRVPFSVTVPMVDNAVAYTFGYQIVLVDDEGTSSSNWYFPRTGR